MSSESDTASRLSAPTRLDGALHAQVLIIDDEPEHAEVMAEALRKPGHVCTIVGGLEAAEDELRHGAFDVIVTDLVMETEDAGLTVLQLAREHQAEAATIMVTAHGDVPTAKAALRGGAYDFIEKPLDLEVFRNLVHRAAETVMLRHRTARLKDQVDAAFGFEGIIGDSPAIRQVIATIRKVAPSNLPVLITGESGTGKELVAAAIHKHSRRASKRYVTFNAAGQSETLIEDQLFGHVRGAFTGAERDREGVFEYADGGTLFLDEIGDMPITMQSKLLRVLETGEIVRLGSNDPVSTDVRFVSATHQDMRSLIAEGRFREDLYFRIKGAEIVVPALRERREDIPRLVHHFLGRFAAELERPVPSITEATMMRLLSYRWPGNVRELANVVQRMVVVADDDGIEVRHVPDDIRSDGPEDEEAERVEFGSLAGVGLDKLEKEAVRQTLAMTGGNREQAANLLGIGERTLYRKLKEYGLK
ncbi:MAG: sigma-54-dependent transcriptional regulator [Planctomycetota bacterium]|jgi:two-component system response regulator HydG